MLDDTENIGLPKRDMPHPGRVLEELYLDAKGWSPADLASAMGCPQDTVSAVLAGTSAITPDFAIVLGEALGTSAQMWTRMQSDYDLFTAIKRKESK